MAINHSIAVYRVFRRLLIIFGLALALISYSLVRNIAFDQQATPDSFVERVAAENEPQTVSRADSSFDLSNAQVSSGSGVLPVDDELLSILNDFTSSFAGEASVAVHDLRNNTYTASNDDTVYFAASLYKVFVANETFKLAEDGLLSLQSELDPERELTTLECVDIMITVSDNPCGVLLQKAIGASKFMPELLAQGITDTNLSGFYPSTTVRDVTTLLANTYNNEYLSLDQSATLLKLLTDQTIADRIPAQLPNDVQVAHKTGDLEGRRHDAGIIYAPSGPYILSVMTGPDLESDATSPQEQAVYESIASLSRTIYEYMESR